MRFSQSETTFDAMATTERSSSSGMYRSRMSLIVDDPASIRSVRTGVILTDCSHNGRSAGCFPHVAPTARGGAAPGRPRTELDPRAEDREVDRLTRGLCRCGR